MRLRCEASLKAICLPGAAMQERNWLATNYGLPLRRLPYVTSRGPATAQVSPTGVRPATIASRDFGQKLIKIRILNWQMVGLRLRSRHPAHRSLADTVGTSVRS